MPRRIRHATPNLDEAAYRKLKYRNGYSLDPVEKSTFYGRTEPKQPPAEAVEVESK